MLMLLKHVQLYMFYTGLMSRRAEFETGKMVQVLPKLFSEAVMTTERCSLPMAGAGRGGRGSLRVPPGDLGLPLIVSQAGQSRYPGVLPPRSDWSAD